MPYVSTTPGAPVLLPFSSQQRLQQQAAAAPAPAPDPTAAPAPAYDMGPPANFVSIGGYLETVEMPEGGPTASLRQQLSEPPQKNLSLTTYHFMNDEKKT